MMRIRTLIAAGAALLVTPLLAATSAAADPVPPAAQYWPWCGHSGDTDGKYCVVSGSRDGVPMGPIVDDTVEVSQWAVFSFEDGGLSMWPYERHPADPGYEDNDVDPAIRWSVTVNTGSINPLTMEGVFQDGTFSVAGNATTGFLVTVNLRSAPINWMFDGTCSVDGCGNDSTRAKLHRSFGQAVLHNFQGSAMSAAEKERSRGRVSATNAETSNIYYDIDANTLVVQLANPHLAVDGTVARGSYTAFLPDPMLIQDMGVPDPSTLTAGRLRVTRTDGTSTTEAPFTVTRASGGIWVNISDITFSTPKYKIRPRPSVPGQPRIRRVAKRGTRAVVRFRPPFADGASPITRYVARCRKGTRPWVVARGSQSPITVSRLPLGKVKCQVRAVNKIGAGRWSKAKTS